MYIKTGHDFRCYSCKKSTRLEVPADIAHFLDPKRDNAGAQNGRTGGAIDEDDASDDVPLLQMEDVNDHEGGWPIYLGMLNRKDSIRFHCSWCCFVAVMSVKTPNK